MTTKLCEAWGDAGQGEAFAFVRAGRPDSNREAFWRHRGTLICRAERLGGAVRWNPNDCGGMWWTANQTVAEAYTHDKAGKVRRG